MATGKQGGKRPTLSITGKKGAKKRVEEMFGGVQQPDDGAPTMRVDVEIPLPEHADPDAENPSVRDIKDRVAALFSSIGTHNMPETAYPTGGRNNGPQAAEFVVADQLKKAAEKRYTNAKKDATDSGCFGDPDSYVAGDTVEVYRTPSFIFSVKKGDPTQMVDRERVTEVLKRIAPSKWQELLKECMKERAGPTQIITSLK